MPGLSGSRVPRGRFDPTTEAGVVGGVLNSGLRVLSARVDGVEGAGGLVG